MPSLRRHQVLRLAPGLTREELFDQFFPADRRSAQETLDACLKAREITSLKGKFKRTGKGTLSMQKEMTIATVYDFFGGVDRDFFGGDDRTGACGTLGHNLARFGIKTLIIDMDIDTPKLSHRWAFHYKVPWTQPGILDLLVDLTEKGPDSVAVARNPFAPKSPFCPIPADMNAAGRPRYDIPPPPDLLPATQLADMKKIPELLGRLSLESLYTEGHGLPCMKLLRRHLETAPQCWDVVILNSPTGFQPMVGACVRDLADVVLYLSTNLSAIKNLPVGEATWTRCRPDWRPQ